MAGREISVKKYVVKLSAGLLSEPNMPTERFEGTARTMVRCFS